MANIDQLTGAVEDAVTYPILTREVNGYGNGGGRNGASPGSSAGGSLTRTAQGAIRDLLGWRYRADDPKGFLAALTKAVDLKESEGHVEWAWKARPFMVQADLGEVTGAQASIYARAKAALDQALPLLDKLEPLRADADKEETASMRALVRNAWVELVSELSVVGGPRIHRIDDYFTQLLGPTISNANQVVYPADPTDEATLQDMGNLGTLALRFGFRRDRVLTVDEEQGLTDWLILFDHTFSLCQTWKSQNVFFSRNGSANKFLGTQLVRLSQALAVIVESVHETYDAMDSVFFGPEERGVTELTLTLPAGETVVITVSELLSWIEQFAGIEAPQLIEDSGKDGVRVVYDTLNRLEDLLDLLTAAI